MHPQRLSVSRTLDSGCFAIAKTLAEREPDLCRRNVNGSGQMFTGAFSTRISLLTRTNTEYSLVLCVDTKISVFVRVIRV